MFKPDRWLKEYYIKANREFFDGKLPDAQVGWNDDMEKAAYGITISVQDDDAKHTSHTIHISKLIKPFWEVSRLTLVHEMAHVKLFPDVRHGKKFQEEMVRLAIRGAFKNLW